MYNSIFTWCNCNEYDTVCRVIIKNSSYIYIYIIQMRGMQVKKFHISKNYVCDKEVIASMM